MKFKESFKVKSEVKQLWDNPNLHTVFGLRGLVKSDFLITNPNYDIRAAIEYAKERDRKYLEDITANERMTDALIAEYNLNPLNKMISDIGNKFKSEGYTDGYFNLGFDEVGCIRNPDTDVTFTFSGSLEDEDDQTATFVRTYVSQSGVWDAIMNPRLFKHLFEFDIEELPEDFEMDSVLPVQKDVEGQMKFEFADTRSKYDLFLQYQKNIQDNLLSSIINDINSWNGEFQEGRTYIIPDDFDDLLKVI